MLVTKIGDELAVRLSAEDAARLGLKEGDEVSVHRCGPTEFNVEPRPPLITDPAERQAAIERLRRFRGIIPDDFKFNRDEANER